MILVPIDEPSIGLGFTLLCPPHVLGIARCRSGRHILSLRVRRVNDRMDHCSHDGLKPGTPQHWETGIDHTTQSKWHTWSRATVFSVPPLNRRKASAPPAIVARRGAEALWVTPRSLPLPAGTGS